MTTDSKPVATGEANAAVAILKVSPVARLILIDLRAGWKLVPRIAGSSYWLTSTPNYPRRGRHRIVYQRSLDAMVKEGVLDEAYVAIDPHGTEAKGAGDAGETEDK